MDSSVMFAFIGVLLLCVYVFPMECTTTQSTVTTDQNVSTSAGTSAFSGNSLSTTAPTISVSNSTPLDTTSATISGKATSLDTTSAVITNTTMATGTTLLISTYSNSSTTMSDMPTTTLLQATNQTIPEVAQKTKTTDPKAKKEDVAQKTNTTDPKAKKEKEAEILRRKNINNGIAAIVVIIGSVLLIGLASCASKLDKPTKKIQTQSFVPQMRKASCDSIDNIPTVVKQH